MAAEQLGGTLPDAIVIGRSSVAGPRSGGYVTFGLSGYELLNTADTDRTIYAVQMPFDFRVEQIQYAMRAGTYATAGSVMVAFAPTASDPWTGETDLLSAAFDLNAADFGKAEAAGTTPTLVDAARDIAKGQWLMVAITHGDATDDTSDLSVWVTGFPKGHVNADPAND